MNMPKDVLAWIIAGVGALGAFFAVQTQAEKASDAAIRVERANETTRSESITALGKMGEEVKAASKAAQEAKDLARDLATENGKTLTQILVTLERVSTKLDGLVKDFDDQKSAVKDLRETRPPVQSPGR